MSELKVHASACNHEPMVQSDEIRGAFTARLKEALARKNIAEWGAGARLAKATGKTPKAASKWLNSEAMPGRDSMLAIAQMLEVRIDWLAHGEGSVQPSAPSEAETAERVKVGRALFDRATPRSQAVLNRIAALEAQGKLTDDDIHILEKIIERFGSTK